MYQRAQATHPLDRDALLSVRVPKLTLGCLRDVFHERVGLHLYHFDPVELARRPADGCQQSRRKYPRATDSHDVPQTR